MITKTGKQKELLEISEREPDILKDKNKKILGDMPVAPRKKAFIKKIETPKGY